MKASYHSDEDTGEGKVSLVLLLVTCTGGGRQNLEAKHSLKEFKKYRVGHREKTVMLGTLQFGTKKTQQNKKQKKVKPSWGKFSDQDTSSSWKDNLLFQQFCIFVQMTLTWAA